MTENNDLKKFTPFDKDIKLVSKPNDLDPFDKDLSILRAELSCGHVTDPEALISCCKAQLDYGKTEFKCPLCEEEWPYDEVRKLAKLTIEEQSSFEEQLGTNTVKKKVDFRECPGCGTLIERSDDSNLNVRCSVCTVKTGKAYEFCWQCMREWKEPQLQADRCGNAGCFIDQKLLRECLMITLENGAQCPKIRKCPSCGMLIEHDNTGCNNMECPECENTFCFICLKPEHNYYNFLPCTLAPRQLNTESESE
ncbi:hypothetical protein Q8A67_002968 [Cirrhinus molitorella]|uniref:RBR-type E3 ubiquitin transferase n=1 Tax=Cirrhinus molitorella TaxID=172907 RepID=A0AA88PZT9_9TELE|nr:hypothetical protein Q8A67_002968 [Cirrhinus molitorella]